jgi:hypothetical protein
LVEESKMLWEGVNTIDVTRLEGSNSFCLKAICMWNIHDFSTYGLFARCQVKGYLTCPFCDPNVDTWHSTHLKTNVYLGHQHYLGRAHPYKRNWVAFNGQPNHKPALEKVYVEDFLRRVEEHEEWVRTRISP